MKPLSKEALKERERTTWASVAEGWRRRDVLLTKGAAPVTNRMLELAGIQAGHHVLDIASGMGEPAITAARMVGNSGRVVGTDLVTDMVRFATEKATRAGLSNITFRCVDGEVLDFDPTSFDAITLRWGLMFMPEPETCLTLAHGMLKNDGRIAIATWAAPDKNPFVSVMMQALGQHMELPKPPPGTPGIFAIADPDRLHAIMASAGFKNIEIESMDIDVIEVANGRAYWEAMSDLAGPVMALVKTLDESTRRAFIDDVIKAAAVMQDGNTLRARGTTWIASASR